MGKPNLDVDFSPKINALREASGLTQAQLAAKVGVTESTIRNWERGRSVTFYLVVFARLCAALDCAPDELVEPNPLAKPQPEATTSQTPSDGERAGDRSAD